MSLAVFDLRAPWGQEKPVKGFDLVAEDKVSVQISPVLLLVLHLDLVGWAAVTANGPVLECSAYTCRTPPQAVVRMAENWAVSQFGQSAFLPAVEFLARMFLRQAVAEAKMVIAHDSSEMLIDLAA